MFTIVTLGTFVLRKMQIIQRKSYIRSKYLLYQIKIMLYHHDDGF